MQYQMKRQWEDITLGQIYKQLQGALASKEDLSKEGEMLSPTDDDYDDHFNSLMDRDKDTVEVYHKINEQLTPIIEELVALDAIQINAGSIKDMIHWVKEITREAQNKGFYLHDDNQMLKAVNVSMSEDRPRLQINLETEGTAKTKS
jgi:hypothetical protein